MTEHRDTTEKGTDAKAFLQDEMKSKVVVITGGNRGIGSGCAQSFCQYGATVVIAARDDSLGKKVADKLTNEYRGSCEFFRCDVSAANQVEELVEFTVRKYGRLDCMINNAGFLPKRRPIDEISVAEFEAVLKTNLIGLFSGCKFALPHLRLTKGSIINMSSILGVAAQEGSSIYCATKGAIISLTKSLAIDEARHGVRVNAVLPGNIRSDLGKEHRPTGGESERATEISKRVQWIRRVGEPLDIGYCCVYLASDMASFVTGAEINVTGGFELGNGLRLTTKELELPIEAFDP